MKNFEKYKTAEEAYKAWDAFCDKQDESCEGCPANISKTKTFEMCSIAWMHLEAEEEEELLPCPFCGCDVMLNEEKSDVLTTYKFECPICYATTSFVETTKGKAIKQWNRRTDK